MEPLDHKNLDKDVPYFAEVVRWVMGTLLTRNSLQGLVLHLKEQPRYLCVLHTCYTGLCISSAGCPACLQALLLCPHCAGLGRGLHTYHDRHHLLIPREPFTD